MHHFLEDHRVNVLAKHIEQEPISDLGLLDDDVDTLLADQPEPDVQQVGAHLGADDDDDPVDDHQEAQDGEGDEPEPEKDVDLAKENVIRSGSNIQTCDSISLAKSSIL